MAEARDKDEKVKKKAVKSKLSRPNAKQKQYQYSVEIASDAVRVVRVDAKGKIIGIGSAPIEGDALWADKSWINRLSQIVRDAAREAKVPKGTSLACTVVAGGQQIIMQRFTWPELAHNAMVENSRHEIASYLPGVQSGFVIGGEVQQKVEAHEDKVASMNVFVAAMPKDMAVAISTAVTWAGFKVISIDVVENVRARLVERFCAVEGSAPKSFGYLDLCSANPNITLYLEGFFYSTHYFSANAQAGHGAQAHGGATIDEIESLMSSLDSIKGSSKAKKFVEHNVEAILSEITFVVDFIKYQERGTSLQCILVNGRTQPGFNERLSSGLDMPVYGTEIWMQSSVIQDIQGDPGYYLDAYASGVPSSVIAAQHMLDLKTDVIIKNPKQRLIIMAASMLTVMGILLAVGLFIPFLREQNLRHELRDMEPEMQRVEVFVLQSITQVQIQALDTEVKYIEDRIDGIDAFYWEFAQASVIVPTIFEAAFTNIYRVEAANDEVTISAAVTNFKRVADIMTHFEGDSLFRNNGISPVREAETEEEESVEDETTRFVLTLIQSRNAGLIAEERAGDR